MCLCHDRIAESCVCVSGADSCVGVRGGSLNPVSVFQELEKERVQLVEDVMSNKRKMKELEDNLLYRLTSTKVQIT